MELSSLNELDFAESGEWPLAVKSIALVLMCVLIWIGAYFLIIKDKEIALKTAETEEVTLKRSYEVKYAKVINLELYKQQMTEMNGLFESMLMQLPRKSEVADLLVDVSRSGLVNGLEFQLFKPGNEQPSDFYAELPIQIRVTGSFHQFAEFISAVAALPRIVTMHDLTLMPLAESNNKMTMDITAKTYRYFEDIE